MYKNQSHANVVAIQKNVVVVVVVLVLVPVLVMLGSSPVCLNTSTNHHSRLRLEAPQTPIHRHHLWHHRPVHKPSFAFAYLGSPGNEPSSTFTTSCPTRNCWGQEVLTILAIGNLSRARTNQVFCWTWGSNREQAKVEFQSGPCNNLRKM